MVIDGIEGTRMDPKHNAREVVLFGDGYEKRIELVENYAREFCALG